MSARLAPSSRPLPSLFVAFLSFFVFPWPSPPRVINAIIIGIRPLLCGSIFRRCFASLAAASITDECTEYFTRSFPNFLQCAGGLKDGTSICAKILQLLDDAPVPEGTVWALLEIDLKNAFNEALRQAAFDVITGKAAREYDNGKVKVGDDLPSFPGLWRFFEYFRAMPDTASTLRYVDHKGQVHHVSGTSGG